MKKTPLMLLRVNRAGEFIAHHQGVGKNQCGKEGARHYRYFVTIEATNKKLTAQGFLMDNALVDEHFQDCYSENGSQKLACDSCENMAQRAVEHFLGMFGHGGNWETHRELKRVDLRRIYVRIHGSDASYIEAEWKKQKSHHGR